MTNPDRIDGIGESIARLDATFANTAESWASALSLVADRLTEVLLDEELSIASQRKLAVTVRWLKTSAAQKAAWAEKWSPKLESRRPWRETETLGFLRCSNRLTNVLHRHEFTTVSDVRDALEDGRLLTLAGVGPKSVREIEWALEDHSRCWWDHEGWNCADWQTLRCWWEETT